MSIRGDSGTNVSRWGEGGPICGEFVGSLHCWSFGSGPIATSRQTTNPQVRDDVRLFPADPLGGAERGFEPLTPCKDPQNRPSRLTSRSISELSRLTWRDAFGRSISWRRCYDRSWRDSAPHGSFGNPNRGICGERILGGTTSSQDRRLRRRGEGLVIRRQQTVILSKQRECGSDVVRHREGADAN